MNTDAEKQSYVKYETAHDDASGAYLVLRVTTEIVGSCDTPQTAVKLAEAYRAGIDDNEDYVTVYGCDVPGHPNNFAHQHGMMRATDQEPTP